MKTQLPIFEKAFEKLDTMMKASPITAWSGDALRLTKNNSSKSEYQYTIDGMIHINSNIRRDFKKNIAGKYSISDEYSFDIDDEIIDFITDAFYQYDFELNKTDNQRKIKISLVEHLFRFKSRLLIKNEQVDTLHEYLIRRNTYHEAGNYSECACDSTGRIKGRENRGIVDIKYFVATIDLIMKDLTHPISYAFESFDEKYTLFSFILTGETNIAKICK